MAMGVFPEGLKTGLALNLRNKPTSQSTTFAADVPAENAVDGDRGTTSHTKEDPNQWWRVDLEAIYCLKKITILNRVDGWGGRLAGAVVRAGLDPSDFSQNTQIGDAVTSSQATNGAVIDFIADPIVSARYVSVKKNANGFVCLAEVMVEEIQDTEETSTVEGKTNENYEIGVDFTLVANPARLGQTGDDNAVIQAYKGSTYASAGIIFGRQLTTGGSNVELPAGSMVMDDPQTICNVTLSSTLPESAGIDRTGVFYAEAVKKENVTRIQTIILNKDDSTVHTRPTQRTQIANIGESVTLQMEDVNSPANSNYRWRHNGGDVIAAWNNQLNANIDNVAVDDGGIYSFSVADQESQQLHGFMRLIVRGCPAGMWGPPSCQNTCRRCYNGGICDDKTGTCICAPGFSGEYCQQVHGRHVFGQNASHTCSDSTDPHNDACRGRMFCLPDPYGCSCAAGYMGLDCMQECAEGKYGADCKQTCHCPSGDSCEKDTGECNGNCIPPYFGSNCQCSTDNGVLGLTVIADDPKQLQVSWQPDACVSGYILEYALTNRGQCEEIESPQWVSLPGLLDGQTTSHVITGLISSSTYMVYIRPQYSGTPGPNSTTSGTTLKDDNPSVSPVVVTSYDSTSVTLSWREVYCANYSVEYALQNKDGCETIDQLNFIQHCMCSGSNSTVIPNLLVNSVYEIRVRAFVDGSGGLLIQRSVTTGTKEPSAPPQQVTVTSTAKRSLNFSWRKPACGSRGGNITGYSYKLSGPGSQLISNVSTAEQVEIDGLIPFTNYSFQVAANNSVGVGPYSEVVVQRTDEAEPTVPLNVAIQNVDDVSITLQWSEPDPPQGIIIHYNVRYWRSEQPGNQTLINDVVQLMHEITGLETNVAYFLQVQAETSVGVGPWSANVTATTQIGVPGPVRNLRWTNTNESSITLDWDEPLKPRGSISHYIVRYRIFSPSEDYNMDEVENSPFTKNGLDPATAYEFNITAQNEKFEGFPHILVVYTKPQSNPAAPPKPPSYDSEATDTTVTIGLTKPTTGGQFVESYVVRVKRVGSVVKRDILVPNQFEDSPNDYIAAELLAQIAPEKFVIGDTQMYGGYYNAPLMTGESYEILTGSVSKGNESDGYVSYSEPLTVTAKKTTTEPPPPVGVIVAVVLVVVILALGLVVGFVVYKRRRASRAKQLSDESDIPLNAKASPSGKSSSFLEDFYLSSVHNYVNDGAAASDTPNKQKPKPTPKPRQKQGEPEPHAEEEGGEQVEFVPPPPVRRDELAEYIRQKEAQGDNGFLADYKSLPDFPLHPWTVAAKPENRAKNRYVNVIAYDHSRVVLDLLEGDPHSDYINACYIDGYKTENKYIASQGPNKASIKDIWRMVWQLGIDKIVMLTNPMENGKMKCLQYWADTGSTILSGIVVTTDKEEVFLDYTIRNFSIHPVGSEVAGRAVKQFHYTTWPDMKPPEYPAPLLNFLRLVNGHHNPGRTMVHCSAGVGRTGTFIALDAMQEQMAQEGQVDVLGFIYQMRQNRIKMVQTPEQYKFLYDALLSASLTGDTTYSVADFRQKLTTLKKKDKGAKETGLQKQFATLIQLSNRRVKVEKKSGQLPENKDKNRYRHIIPGDRSRPFLSTRVHEDETNYINATFLPGYRKKNMYIGTQMPMPNTVTDFWRLMYDHKATSIVMLNTFDVKDKTMCRYWPEKGTINFGKLSVELIQTKRSDSVTRCTFTLKNTTNAVLGKFNCPATILRENCLITQNTSQGILAGILLLPGRTSLSTANFVLSETVSINLLQSEEARTITQFQYHDWPSDQEILNSVPGMLTLMDLTRKWNGDKGPIVVHCMDGLGSTSVYCTLMALLEQFNVEKAVDVFQAAHRLRMVNQNMMNSLDKYALCYDVIQAMLDSTSIYENVTPSAGPESAV
ncbi:receptor-type tyrosine-protein phosphatase mu-like [Patiria miniata]|uniref:Protein-tyrosine-phosphatase n=1 Tax=Patiria miniata TaxID=46514 RepID=A0A914ATN1_PATMI|nr:receptor-type tyrosine-protein phosphatase mu-like [Patiria miniata]